MHPARRTSKPRWRSLVSGSARNVDQKRTAVKKDHQKVATAARKCGAPETVSVAMGRARRGQRDGLLALAVGPGLQVMAAVMEQDVTAVCGPKGRDRRHQGLAGAGRGIDREHHHGDRPAGRPAGTRAGHRHADPGRYRRCEGARGGGERVSDHPVIQRCQLHKQRNVTDRLPDDLAPWSANGCAPPTTPTPRWPLRPSSKPSPASSSGPTRARPGRCGKGWRRPSPCCG